MSIRIIDPNGKITEVMPSVESKGNKVFYFCNMHTLEHNLIFGKLPVKKAKTNKTGPHFIIEFSVSAFRSLAITDALSDLAKRIKKEKNWSLAKKPLVMDAAMQQCISAIANYSGSEETKNIFMYARVTELLWLQQENYLRAQKPRTVYVKTEYDKERIVFARDHLLTHMDAPPTLIELAAIAGLNEFKLKKGFKELFDQTVFGYLAEVRLAMACRALREKKKTISRIAFELGYASLQHFSAAFKKKFGVSPAKY